MKLLAVFAVLLLAVLVYRVPTAKEIGDGIIQAQEDHLAKLQEARWQREQQVEAAHERAEGAARQEKERIALSDRQAEFDALPKWDALGKPINRVPPPGLAETKVIPPSTFRPIIQPTPSPAETAASIARRFGGKQ